MNWTILSLALLIQILYYIILDAHYVIVLFIVLSLALLKFSNKEHIFLLIPMVICHTAYLFLPRPSYEGFKLRRVIGGGGIGGGGGGGGGCKEAKWKKKYEKCKEKRKRCMLRNRMINSAIEEHDMIR